MYKMIRFWEEGLLFCDGWYLYTNGKGDYSIISKKSAMKKMEDYQRYQVSQDTGRAGLSHDIAFSSRGFQKIDGKYVYVGKEIENLATSPIHEIPEILTIPQKVGDYPITYIAKNAFFEEPNIKKLVLHDKIKSIEQNSFADCINLSQIENMPEWITIGKDAFNNTQINKNEQIHYLNHVLIKAETTCSGKIVIKEGIHAISDNAFENCKDITEVILPQSMRKIGAYAFQNCTNLEYIHMPDEIDFIGENAFYGCTKLNNVIIPKGVQFIRLRTFENCQCLSQIKISHGIRRISYNAFNRTAFMNQFYESNETEIYLNDWLIRYKYDCTKILKVRPGTVGVADMDWSDTKTLKGIDLPEGLKYIGSDAFRINDIKAVQLPQGLLTIERAAFRYTSIREVIIPASVKKVDAWAFMDCERIERIIIPGENTEIVWPAITDRRDKNPITIIAHPSSSAHEYCKKYGEKYNLHFLDINKMQKG